MSLRPHFCKIALLAYAAAPFQTALLSSQQQTKKDARQQSKAL